MARLSVYELHTIEEITHYGMLGDIVVDTEDKWAYISGLVNKVVEQARSDGFSEGCLSKESELLGDK